MSTPHYHLSAGLHLFLISLMDRSVFTVHSYWTSISIFETVWPDNVMTTQHAPYSHFLHTKSAILMLMRLGLSLKAHILFLHVTTKVEVCLVSEKTKSKKSGWSSIRWLMVCPKPRLSSLFESVWSSKSVSYTKTGENPAASCAWLNSLKDLSLGTNVLWISSETAPAHSHDVIFYPDWHWLAVATFTVFSVHVCNKLWLTNCFLRCKQFTAKL